MNLTLDNKEKFINKVLTKIIRDHLIRWLEAYSWYSDFNFNLNHFLNRLNQFHVNQIKQYVFESAFLHKNLWCIYEEIKDIKNMNDLLLYISPNPFYIPECILLGLLRSSGKILPMEIFVVNTIFVLLKKMAWRKIMTT